MKRYQFQKAKTKFDVINTKYKKKVTINSNINSLLKKKVLSKILRNKISNNKQNYS